jgi:arachidonate 5-lipoxygenase
MSDELLPSRYRLPHQCSPDRRRARAARLRSLRDAYGLVEDAPVLHEGASYTLPPRIARMPDAEAFTPVKRAWIVSRKSIAAVNALAAMGLNPSGRMSSPRDYARALVSISGPPLMMERWRDDDEFARQRLNGANPHELARWSRKSPDDDAVKEAAESVLRHRLAPTVDELDRGGRLFAADYTEMAHPLVQQYVAPGFQLAAPLGVFYADDDGLLHPLAIRLAKGGEVVTPLAPDARWLHARSHLQAADGLIHEGVRHLLETHLVMEVVAVVTAGQLHPDHPVCQLLAPHLRFTVAIDCLARGDLLSPGGPIDLAVAAGVGGAMNLGRMRWSRWTFDDLKPEQSFKRRELDEKVLTEWWYRDDALALYALIERYVGEVLTAWYQSDEDVVKDYELQAWASELVRIGKLRGFPAPISKFATLRDALATLVYTATGGHAAVNNGQFDKYTWVPNSPGSMRAVPLEADQELTEDELWRAFPPRKRAIAQLSMAWILSTPTDRSIIAAGNVEAFDPALSPPAARAVGVFRRELKTLSATIGRRNAELARRGKVPYTWLDPYNVSCSIDT